MMDVTLRDYKFFKENGGYIVGQRALGAIHLARAERLAEFHGFTFEWDADDDGDLGDHEYWCATAFAFSKGYHMDGTPIDKSYNNRNSRCEHETLYAVMKSPDGDVVASLGSIIDPTSDYQRVVEAELALEHFGAIASLEVAS